MIYAFDKPHKVGTVCGYDCPICKFTSSAYMTDRDGNRMPLQPVLILRESTFEEHAAELRAEGGKAHTLPGCYYYEVSTD